MIVGVYATLGVFLLIASRNPQANRSLIWFAVWSSVVHAGIMAVQSLPAEHRGHLLGDVPAPSFPGERTGGSRDRVPCVCHTRRISASALSRPREKACR